jgi:hypothetical protein
MSLITMIRRLRGAGEDGAVESAGGGACLIAPAKRLCAKLRTCVYT